MPTYETTKRDGNVYALGPTDFYINSERIMTSEHPDVVRVAEELAQGAHGDVLEVGFGMGITHSHLHANPDVNSIFVVEKHRPVIEHYLKCNCRTLSMPWESFVDQTGPSAFDHIVFDAIYPNETADVALRFKHLLRPGGSFTLLQSNRRRYWTHTIHMPRGPS